MDRRREPAEIRKTLACSRVVVVALTLLTSASEAVLVTIRTNESLSEIPTDMDLASTTIDLSYNNISACGKNAFSSYSILNVLRMDDNAVRTVHERAFEGTAVEELYLPRNELDAVPNLTAVASTLAILDLRWNAIRTVGMVDLLPLTSLVELKLSGNPLASFNVSDSVLLGDTVTYCSHCLEKLHLQDIPTGVASGAVYTGLSCLSYLSLDRCGVSSFDQIQNIRTLNGSLNKLSLRGNVIRDVPEELLHHLGVLSEIYLDNNAIETFKQNTVSLQSLLRPGSLVNVYLYDNPAVCNCEWSWLLDASFIAQDPDTSRLVHVPKGLVVYINTKLCQIGGPDTLREYSWGNLTQTLLCPPTTTADYVSTSTTSEKVPTADSQASMTSSLLSSTSPSSSKEDSPPKARTQQSVTSSWEITTVQNIDERIQLSWNTWISWSECSAPCGGGLHYSLKVCDVMDVSANCSKPLMRDNSVVLYYSVSQQPCNGQPCPVNGYWATWSNWTVCSATCGTGTMTRVRTCVGPYDNGKECQGTYQENDLCAMDDCIEKRVEPVDLHDGQVYLEADKRQSAVSIGVVSVILLGIELGIVLVLDLHSIALACRRLQARALPRCCKRPDKYSRHLVAPADGRTAAS